MKIAIVNSSDQATEVLRQVLSSRPQHQIAWTTHDGDQAVHLCAQEKPDLLLMDLLLRTIDGVEATRRIMASTPCAILIVTDTVEQNVPRVYEAMGCGALDAVNTPLPPGEGKHPSTTVFLFKIDRIEQLLGERAELQSAPLSPHPSIPGPRSNFLVTVGASAGGPAALALLLSGLPKGFPGALVLIQHVDGQFALGLAEWLGQHSQMPVRLALEGDQPTSGTALIAGSNDHLVLLGSGRLSYTREPADLPYRPSIDVFFQSVQKFWQGDAVGVLLTGMGRDGAKGLKVLRDKGYHTVAQDQSTSAVYGMPKAAANLGAAVDILPLPDIAGRLLKLSGFQPAKSSTL